MPKSRHKAARKPSPAKTNYAVDLTFGQALLAACGPLLRAALGPPQAHSDAIRAAGGEPPPFVPGSMLLDTGATRTAIALSVARQLGLQPTRIAPGYGAAGRYELEAFYVRLMMAFKSGDRQLNIVREQEVVGIPDLDEMGARLGVTDSGGPVRIIGLLGRDFLRHSKFNYDGVRGIVHFVFDAATIRG